MFQCVNWSRQEWRKLDRVKMKIHIILFCCLCKSLVVGANYETGRNATVKEPLKDIRLVTVNKPEPLRNSPLIKEQNEYLKQRTTAQPKATRLRLTKSGGERKKHEMTSQSRVGDSYASESNDQAQMQKIANQLYLAQKRASLLSDYQKFIISQDPNVKNYVLGQSTQNRSPKPFSTKRATGRSLSVKPKYVTIEPPRAESYTLGKIVVVTPKARMVAEKTSKPQNDNKVQETHVKYVTLAPQPLTHFAATHEPIQKVTLLPYHTSQRYYYDVGVTSKPQTETVQIATTPSLGLGAYKYQQPQHLHMEDEHEDNLHEDDSKYEFMYKVKDHEKNSHFGHKESRSDKMTYGYYFVQLPDGRMETVKYWADKTGYHAKVDYEGQAKHPPHTDHKLNVVYH